MNFQKVHWWPRPVRIRLQGSEPGTVCQSFLGIKNAASYKTMRQIGGPRGIRTLDLSDANRTLSQLSYRPIFRGVTRLGDQPTYSPFECPQLCGAQKRYACTPNSLAFVHTLCTAREEKSTYIRLYRIFCHSNYLSWSQIWSPSRWFSKESDLGCNMVGGQVSYRPLRYSSHGVQMYRISIYNKIRCTVKA